MIPLSHLVRVLQWQCVPHEPETRFLQRRLPRGSLDVFVDIGANFGMYAHLMAPKAKQVVAFEPGPARFAHLSEVYGDRFQMENAAVGDTDGQAILRMPVRGTENADDLATLSTDNTFGTSQIDEISDIPVQVVTLDSYFPDTTRRVDFVKIDVEGHEYSVVKGGLALLQRDHPALLIETELRHSPHVADLFDLLEQQGYKAARLLRGGKLAPVSASDLHHLQSPDRLRKREGNPLSRVYVNNIFFLHPDSRVSEHLGFPGR